MAAPPDARTLPLEDMHVSAGARFGAFAGWRMPLSYPLGVLKEHLWTRAHAGLFDISHMRLFRVEGADAARFLAHACPLDPAGMALGQSRLSLLLDEQAGILDDLIVTRLGADRFAVVANAGNAEADERHLRALAAPFDLLTITAVPCAILALQGPEAEDALRRAGVKTLPQTFMTGLETDQGWFITRSGYTGEDGFELSLPADAARRLATALLADPAVEWIGLAARDSLRLEAGLCLHGQDIGPDIDPAAAGLLWAIPKPVRETGAFLGAAALAASAAAGPSRKRVGLRPEGRQPVRAGAPLFSGDGTPVGTVTSGGFGPSADHPVSMGLVASSFAAPSTSLHAEVRGAKVPVVVSSLPFIPHRYRRG
ncbi:MAG: glycine cleavage system aminomethyltransferase GcvT [Mesorhizobium amorphae]|nr:MAG: glycine cleavage system aminomethyltransferase GcvT [Mesorhizobium amorphae]